MADPHRSGYLGGSGWGAAQEVGTGTSTDPAPPHSPAQVTGASEAERARSTFGALFCAPACDRKSDLRSHPSGRGSGGWVTGACVGAGGRACGPLFTPGVLLAPQPSPSLPPGRPASLEISPADPVPWLIPCVSSSVPSSQVASTLGAQRPAL